MRSQADDIQQQLSQLWRDPAGIQMKERIGRGSSGVVYRAVDSQGRVLAVKLITGVHLEESDLAGLLNSSDRDVGVLRRELLVMARVAKGVPQICRWVVASGVSKVADCHDPRLFPILSRSLARSGSSSSLLPQTTIKCYPAPGTWASPCTPGTPPSSCATTSAARWRKRSTPGHSWPRKRRSGAALVLFACLHYATTGAGSLSTHSPSTHAHAPSAQVWLRHPGRLGPAARTRHRHDGPQAPQRAAEGQWQGSAGRLWAGEGAEERRKQGHGADAAECACYACLRRHIPLPATHRPSLLAAQSFTSVQGTVAYMAPEQHNPRQAGVGPAADVWGFAATMVHVLGGRPPFEGMSAPEITSTMLSKPQGPELPSQAGYTPGLPELLAECFQPEAAARPTAEQALARLQGIMNVQQVRLCLLPSCDAWE
jgi:serine/threonine protein kinase